MHKSFHKSFLGLVVASSALGAGATAASATDVLIDDDVTVVEESALPDEDETLVGETPAPAVYGWIAPPDCGTYYYWDGERCADARAYRLDDDD